MKIALYGRVSTERQERQATIQSQLAALRDFAASNGHTIMDEYVDDGYSGELFDRPALDRLRDDAQKGNFEAVLVHSPDRLSRRFIHQGLLEDELKRHGIGIVYVNRPNAGDTPEDHLFSGMQGLFAEYEKAKILERTRRGRLHKAKRGLIVGGPAPYGYRYVLGEGRYVLEPGDAKIVQLVFKIFLDGMSIRAIARELTQRGVRPKHGLEWRTSSLHKILRNETYAGVWYFNKLQNVEPKADNGQKYRRLKNTARILRPRDQWVRIDLPEALRLVTREDFEAVQCLLKRNSQLSPRNVKYRYLLRGLVFCAQCEAPFHGTPYHSRLFYRCGNRHRTFPKPAVCRAGSIGSERLEGVVWRSMIQLLADPALITEQLGQLAQTARRDAPRLEAVLADVEGNLATVRGQRDRLLDAYRAGAVTLEQLKDQMAKVSQQEAALQTELGSLQVQRSQTAEPAFLRRSVRANCGHILRRLHSTEGDFQGRRKLLLDLVEQIVLDLGGKTLRIRGAIPARRSEESGIASTSLGRDGARRRRLRARASHRPGL